MSAFIARKAYKYHNKRNIYVTTTEYLYLVELQSVWLGVEHEKVPMGKGGPAFSWAVTVPSCLCCLPEPATPWRINRPGGESTLAGNEVR